jgi:carboxyl-terminal processing protease
MDFPARCRHRSLWVPALLATLLSACLPILGGGPSGGDTERRRIEPALAAATFDTAWTRIRDTYYDPTMRGIDWAAVRDELYPAAAASRTYGELRGVLREMVGRIGESHFGIIPMEAVRAIEEAGAAAGEVGGAAEEAAAAAAEEEASADAASAAGSGPGDAGIELRIVEEQLVVWRVAADAPAEADGVRPGFVVESIDGRPVAALLRTLAGVDGTARRDAELRLILGLQAAMHGPAGETLQLAVYDADGTLHHLDVRRRQAPGQPVQFGNLPELRAHLEHDIVEHAGANIGVARFNVWMPVLGEEFERAMSELRDADGIVLDLRGNTGGVAGMVMRIAGHFIDEPVPLGLLQLRGNEMRFVVNPQRVDAAGRAVEPYIRPLALLTDELSASTTEIFAAGMRHVGRATIFGERTAGQALPAVLNRLPNGDVLMHVIADLRTPDGTRLEGHGVAPDMTVPLYRAELLEGVDAPLLAALDWIAANAPRRSAVARVRTAGGGAGAAATGGAAGATAQRAEGEPLPAAGDVLARFAAVVGASASFPDEVGVRAVGRFSASGNDVSGTVVMVHGVGGRSFVRVSIPAYGDVLQGSDGRVAWEVTPGTPARLLRGRELDQMREDLDARALVRDTTLFERVETVGLDEFDGDRCFKVLLVWQSGRETHDCYSVDSGLLIATVAPHVSPAGENEVTTRYRSYREFGGIHFATEISQQLLGTEQVIVLDNLEITPLETRLFEPPAQVRRLIPRR